MTMIDDHSLTSEHVLKVLILHSLKKYRKIADLWMQFFYMYFKYMWPPEQWKNKQHTTAYIFHRPSFTLENAKKKLV